MSLAGPETAKGSPFLPDELAFSLRKKKKERGKEEEKRKKDLSQKCSWLKKKKKKCSWLHSADKLLTLNEKFQCKKRNGNSSSKIHLLLKLSANNRSEHFANGGVG